MTLTLTSTWLTISWSNPFFSILLIALYPVWLPVCFVCLVCLVPTSFLWKVPPSAQLVGQLRGQLVGQGKKNPPPRWNRLENNQNLDSNQVEFNFSFLSYYFSSQKGLGGRNKTKNFFVISVLAYLSTQRERDQSLLSSSIKKKKFISHQEAKKEPFGFFGEKVVLVTMTNLDLVNQSFLIETDFFFETKKGNIWKPFLRNSEGNQWKISHCLSYNCQLSLDLGTKKKKGWISLFKDRIQKVIELRTWERYSETNKKDGHHPINPKKNIPPKSHWHKKETKTSLLLSHHLLTYLELFKKNLQKKSKNTTPSIPVWSPTTVLTWPSEA